MNMNLKGIMQTLGAKPGQVMSDPYARAWASTPSPIKEAEGEDHEVSMAQNSLDTIIKMTTELKAKMGENEKEIPAWIQDHIAKAENLISQASSNYHEYGTNEAGINGADRFPTLNAESVNEAASVSQVRSTIEKVKKELIQKWKQKGGYENFGEKEGRMLSDKFNANPYGSSDERRIHSMIQDFENWAMNYDGRSESVNEEEIKWNAVENAIINFLKMNTKILDKRVKDRDTEGVKGGLKSIISGLTNAQRSLKLESVNEGKFKKDDLVYNTRTKTVGIVRLGDDKYGEVKTDADGNVDVDELEKYNPIKHKHQQNAKVAPSTEKEINNRGLFNPFKAESLRLKNIK